MKGNWILILEIHDTFIFDTPYTPPFSTEKTMIMGGRVIFNPGISKGSPSTTNLIPSHPKGGGPRHATYPRTAAASCERTRCCSGVSLADGGPVVGWCFGAWGLGLGVVSYGRFLRGLSNLDDSPIFFWQKGSHFTKFVTSKTPSR